MERPSGIVYENLYFPFRKRLINDKVSQMFCDKELEGGRMYILNDYGRKDECLYIRERAYCEMSLTRTSF